MLIGFDVYLFYGIKKSSLSDHLPATHARSNRIVSICGIVLVALLAIVALIHHATTADDSGLFIFSLVFAALHLLVFLLRVSKK
jgi:APA family basic amino acid/polyamine antiporter